MIIQDRTPCSCYQGQGDVLLFIHGLGSSSAVWKKQLEALKQDYQLMTVDLYGHGNNTKTPSDISIKQTAKIISEEIREKELSNITIVGHSLGGLIAIELADHNKHIIDRLILIDVPTKQTGMTLFNSLFLKILEKDFPRVVKEHYKKMTRDERLLDELLETALSTDKNSYYQYMKSLLETDYSKMARSLYAQVYLFVSSSLVKDKAKVTQRMRKYGYERIQEDRLYYYSEKGHFLMIESADDFNRDLLKILSD